MEIEIVDIQDPFGNVFYGYTDMSVMEIDISKYMFENLFNC